jgi:hypothetical protein
LHSRPTLTQAYGQNRKSGYRLTPAPTVSITVRLPNSSPSNPLTCNDIVALQRHKPRRISAFKGNFGKAGIKTACPEDSTITGDWMLKRNVRASLLGLVVASNSKTWPRIYADCADQTKKIRDVIRGRFYFLNARNISRTARRCSYPSCQQCSRRQFARAALAWLFPGNSPADFPASPSIN